MYPMDCQTCGFHIGDLWCIFFKLKEIYKNDYSEPLRLLGIRDECCRRMFISVIPGQYDAIN